MYIYIYYIYIYTHGQYIVFPRKSATDTLPTLWNRDRRKINGLFTLKSTGVISQRDDGNGFMDIFYQNWCFLNMVSKVDYLQIVNVLSAVSKTNRGNFASVGICLHVPLSQHPNPTRSNQVTRHRLWVVLGGEYPHVSWHKFTIYSPLTWTIIFIFMNYLYPSTMYILVYSVNICIYIYIIYTYILLQSKVMSSVASMICSINLH